MATKVGSLIINLALESGAFRSGLNATQKELKTATKRMEAMGESIRGLGQKMSMGITLPFLALGKVSIDAARESADALGSVKASLASMGNASGRTVVQLQALANTQMGKSLYDDDEILRSVTSTLLNFGKISGESFDRAQQAAIDFSAKFGKDLQSSALLVGKALNDPINGLGALQKAGVKLDDGQKQQIATMMKLGDVAGAQGIVFEALGKAVNGQAQAARDADPTAALTQSMNQFKESVGTSLTQALPPITNAITSLLNTFNSLSPGTQDTIVKMIALSAAAGPVLTVFGNLVKMTSPLTGLMGVMLKGKDVAGIFKNIGPAVLSVGRAIGGLLASNPILLAIGVAAFAVYQAWQHWDEIKAVIKRVGAAISNWWNGTVMPVLTYVWDKVKMVAQVWWDLEKAGLKAIASLVTGVANWLKGKLDATWKWLNDKIQWIQDKFQALYKAVVGNSYIPDMVNEIGQHIARLDALMVKPIEKATDRSATAFRKLGGEVAKVFSTLGRAQGAALTGQGGKLRLLLAGISPGGPSPMAGMIDAAQRAAVNDNRQVFKLAQAGITSGPSASSFFGDMAPLNPAALAKFKSVASVMKLELAAVGAVNVKVAKSFKDMADATLSAVDKMLNAFKGGGFLDILGAVIGLGLQLGSIGAFGKGVAKKINAVPSYATGTTFHPGGLATINERGGELVNLPRGSQVTPHSALGRGGGNTYHLQGNLLTPEFWAQIQRGDVQAAAAGAQGGAARVFARQRRMVG